MVSGLVAGIVVAVVIGLAVLASPLLLMMRNSRSTRGDRYYGLPAPDRQKIKRRFASLGRLMLPIASVTARLLSPRMMSFEVDGVCGPALNSSAGIFRAAANFRPGTGDVFVATQMKCGTTWMQQVAYEVMLRGQGDFSDNAHRHLYATSPWIDADASVGMDLAPRLGPERWRLIKTHLPAQLCPWTAEARYIYVTRHPVACFSSIVDFVHLLAGPFAAPRSWLLDWYLSDRMWWSSWPSHVSGWWARAQEHGNVLFIHYEEMLADLPECIDRVAVLLGIKLTGEQREAIAAKCSFAFMKQHEEVFEMNPPTLFSELDTGSFLAGGTRAREEEGDAGERSRILDYCKQELQGSSYPCERFYPDIITGVVR